MTIEALKLALESLDNLMYWDNGKPEYDEAKEAITAIKEALERSEQIPPSAYSNTHQPEQEPVAWAQFSEAGNLIDLLEEPCGGYVPLYTTPPQRKPLTDEQIAKVRANRHWMTAKDKAPYLAGIRDAEAAHGIKWGA